MDIYDFLGMMVSLRMAHKLRDRSLLSFLADKWIAALNFQYHGVSPCQGLDRTLEEIKYLCEEGSVSADAEQRIEYFINQQIAVIKTEIPRCDRTHN